MNLMFNMKLVENYKSNSQKARVLTEDWVNNNVFCPICGNKELQKFENNKPVADFYCENCNEIFELKSKNGKFSNIINDGAYSTMIERIASNSNPDFLFLTYNKEKCVVENFLIIPKHFFVPNIIIKRKPLSENARRAGWIGCNIDLASIPKDGKVFIIKDGKEISKKRVLNNIQKNLFLSQEKITNRGWILDVMKCIEKIDKKVFMLSDVYSFEKWLHMLHPKNNNIKAKIRQQLQILRDNNYLEFLGNGVYMKKE